MRDIAQAIAIFNSAYGLLFTWSASLGWTATTTA